jgi:hypothetical protein
MKTRSQTNYEKSAIYEVNIDFDGASEAWKSNKKSIGNGMYKYLCSHKKSINHNNCTLKCVQGENYCKKHLKLFNEGKI